MNEFDKMLEEHAKVVHESAKAWTIMCDAQEKSRETRDAEHKSAKKIKEYISSRIKLNLENSRFEPVELL